MEFDKVIRKRTATRSFKSDEVSDSKISKILEAGRVAPTAKNKQPQLVLVAKSKEALEKIDKLTNFRYNAPVVLIVCSDKDIAFKNRENTCYIIDATIVATHMMLEATNQGLDNIWIEMFDKEILKNEFNLNDNIEPICLLPIGYKTDDYLESPMHNVRKELKEMVRYV